MCRALLYLGNKNSIDNFIVNPSNSLIQQSHSPMLMRIEAKSNLAGFGFASWDELDEKKEPLIYKTNVIPCYDKNLNNISAYIQSNCLLAHVRGVPYSFNEKITIENAHPFCYSYKDYNIAFAHNGRISSFGKLKHAIFPYLSEKFFYQISGSTDSEWIYALFMSILDKKKYDGQINIFCDAIIQTLETLQSLMIDKSMKDISGLNLFFSDGNSVIATRYTFIPPNYKMVNRDDFFSLWYTCGDEFKSVGGDFGMTKSHNKQYSSLLIASEPLTKNMERWHQIPDYSMFVGKKTKKGIDFEMYDINL